MNSEVTAVMLWIACCCRCGVDAVVVVSTFVLSEIVGIVVEERFVNSEV